MKPKTKYFLMFLIFSILGCSLVLAVLDPRSWFTNENIPSDDVNINSLGNESNIPHPFIYENYTAPPNSIGIKNYINQIVNWSWIENQTSYTLTNDEEDVTDTLMVNFSYVFTHRKYSYNFTAGKRGYFEFTLVFDSLANSSFIDWENHTVFFNYSDGKLFYNFSDIWEIVGQFDSSFNLSGSGIFTMVLGRICNKNVHISMDPLLGYKTIAGTASATGDIITGTLHTMPDTSGEIYYGHAYLRASWGFQPWPYATMLVYDDDDILIAESTSNVLLVGGSVPGWYNFSFSSEALDPLEDVYICVWGSNEGGSPVEHQTLFYYDTGTSNATYKDSETYNFGNAPNPWSGVLFSSSMSISAYIVYNETAAGGWQDLIMNQDFSFKDELTQTNLIMNQDFSFKNTLNQTNLIMNQDFSFKDIVCKNLNTSEEFSSIQDAIDDSNTLDGHTILIYTGVITEPDIEITKDLTIRGEDRETTVFYPVSRVSNAFIIYSTSESYTVKLENMNITNGCGVLVQGNHYFTMRNVTFYNTDDNLDIYEYETRYPRDVLIDNCSFIKMNDMGIRILNVHSDSDVTISNCTFDTATSNWFITIEYCSNVNITNCTFENSSVSESGIRIIGDVIVTFQNISYNGSESDYGIYVYDWTENCTIRNSNISNCSIGILFDNIIGVDDENIGCRVYNNYITNCSIGVKIIEDFSEEYTLPETLPSAIFNNYFADNTINANTTTDVYNVSWNTTKQSGTNIIGGSYLGGNYWDDYLGEDTTGDGLGDTFIPYNCSGNITDGGDYLPLTTVGGIGWNNLIMDQDFSFKNTLDQTNLIMDQDFSFKNTLDQTNLIMDQDFSFKDVLEETNLIMNQDFSFKNTLDQTNLIMDQDFSFKDVTEWNNLIMDQDFSFKDVLEETNLIMNQDFSFKDELTQTNLIMDQNFSFKDISGWQDLLMNQDFSFKDVLEETNLIMNQDFSFSDHVNLTVYNPYPVNNSVDQPLTIMLHVDLINNVNGTVNMTWYWGFNDTDFIYLDKKINVSTGTYYQMFIGSNYSTTFYIKVIANNNTISTSIVYHFTTEAKITIQPSVDHSYRAIFSILIFGGLISFIVIRRRRNKK